jgi:hypothetical protein
MKALTIFDDDILWIYGAFKTTGNLEKKTR